MTLFDFAHEHFFGLAVLAIIAAFFAEQWHARRMQARMHVANLEHVRLTRMQAAADDEEET